MTLMSFLILRDYDFKIFQRLAVWWARWIKMLSFLVLGAPPLWWNLKRNIYKDCSIPSDMGGSTGFVWHKLKIRASKQFWKTIFIIWGSEMTSSKCWRTSLKACKLHGNHLSLGEACGGLLFWLLWDPRSLTTDMEVMTLATLPSLV